MNAGGSACRQPPWARVEAPGLAVAPHSAWTVRRSSVSVPLVIVALLLALATSQVAQWNAERSRGIFERGANAAAQALETKLLSNAVKPKVHGGSLTLSSRLRRNPRLPSPRRRRLMLSAAA